MRHPDPAPADGDDGTGRQVFGVAFQDLLHHFDPGLRGNVRKANQATVAFSLKENQIPEVFYPWSRGFSAPRQPR
jgi:hypothetical protein